jgi:hypothetical protein
MGGETVRGSGRHRGKTIKGETRETVSEIKG